MVWFHLFTSIVCDTRRGEKPSVMVDRCHADRCGLVGKRICVWPLGEGKRDGANAAQTATVTRCARCTKTELLYTDSSYLR